MPNVKLVQAISDLSILIDEMKHTEKWIDGSIQEIIEKAERIKSKLDNAYEYGEKERVGYRDK